MPIEVECANRVVCAMGRVGFSCGLGLRPSRCSSLITAASHRRLSQIASASHQRVSAAHKIYCSRVADKLQRPEISEPQQEENIINMDTVSGLTILSYGKRERKGGNQIIFTVQVLEENNRKTIRKLDEVPIETIKAWLSISRQSENKFRREPLTQEIMKRINQ